MQSNTITITREELFDARSLAWQAGNFNSQTIAAIFFYAIYYGRTELASQMLQSGEITREILQARESLGQETALIAAARLGRQEIVREILALSFKIGSEESIAARDNLGYTALIHAAAKGHHEVVGVLLEDHSRAAWVAATGNNGKNALMVAAYSGHTTVIEQLLAVEDSQEMPAQRNDAGSTALELAISAGNLEAAKLLLPRSPLTPELLKYAVSSDSAKEKDDPKQASTPVMVELLLSDSRFNSEIFSAAVDSLSSALDHAISLGDAAILQRLVQAMNSAGFERCPPLIWAIIRNNVAEFRQILAADDCDLSINYMGWPALNLAAALNRHEIIPLLLDAKNCPAEILAVPDKFSKTALVRAAEAGHAESVAAMMNSRNGVDLRAVLPESEITLTPTTFKPVDGLVKLLRAAIQCDRDDIVQNLFKMKDIAWKQIELRILKEAVRNNDQKIIAAARKFPEHGPEIFQEKDYSGDTLLDLAIKYGDGEILQQLVPIMEEAGLARCPPLIRAIIFDDVDDARKILTAATAEDFKVKYHNWPALNVAAALNRAEIIKLLLGAESCPGDILGTVEEISKFIRIRLPLDEAAAKGHQEAINEILASSKCQVAHVKDALASALTNWRFEVFGIMLDWIIAKGPQNLLHDNNLLARAVENDQQAFVKLILSKLNKFGQKLNEYYLACLNNLAAYSIDTVRNYASFMEFIDIIIREGNYDSVTVLSKALNYALRLPNQAIFAQILASDRCTTEVLSQIMLNEGPFAGSNLLMLGCSNMGRKGNDADFVKPVRAQISELILRSGKCTTELLNAKNAQGKDALMLAAEYSNAAIVDEILTLDGIEFASLERARKLATDPLIRFKLSVAQLNFRHAQNEIADSVSLGRGRKLATDDSTIYESKVEQMHVQKFFRPAANTSRAEDQVKGVIAILEDYSCSWKNFFRLHWNRHHTKEAKELVTKIKLLPDQNKKEGILRLINEYEMHCINHRGSFARRISLCLKQLSRA